MYIYFINIVSQEEIAKIQVAFKYFTTAKAKDGVIDLKEFQTGMGYVSLSNDFLFKSFNKGENIDCTKFLLGMATLLKGSQTERLKCKVFIHLSSYIPIFL